MAEAIKTGTTLIKDGALLPEALRFESEPYVPGWGLVTDLDAYALDQKIHEAGWTFFCLAGEIKATVFGFDGQKMVRRAVKRILAKLRSERFNSLQITQVHSERFLGVPYTSVSAHSRHVQESLFLFRAKDVREWGRAELTAARTNAIGLARCQELPLEEMKLPNVATI